MARDHLHQPITGERWIAIQDNAKAAARTALATNDTKGLTALGRAYFHALKETNGKNI